MFVTLVVLVLVQGKTDKQALVRSEEENGNNSISCSRNFENNEMMDVIPNREELLRRCPIAQEEIECRIEVAIEAELNFEMDDLFETRRFLGDMCYETSYLHQGYVNNFDCFKSVMDEWYGCKESASGVVEEFRKSSYDFQSNDLYAAEEEGMKEYRTFDEAHCLLNAHAFACIGNKIQETCGLGAYHTYAEIMIRGRFARDFCDSYAVKHFMKGYLDYLSIENKTTEIDIIRDLFNVETD